MYLDKPLFNLQLFFFFSRTPLHMCAGHPSGTEMSCILVEHGARICDNSIDGTRPLDLFPVSIFRIDCLG